MDNSLQLAYDNNSTKHQLQQPKQKELQQQSWKISSPLLHAPNTFDHFIQEVLDPFCPILIWLHPHSSLVWLRLPHFGSWAHLCAVPGWLYSAQYSFMMNHRDHGSYLHLVEHLFHRILIRCFHMSFISIC